MRQVLCALLVVLTSCTGPKPDSAPGTVADLSAPSPLPAGVHDVLAAATEFEIYALHPYSYPLEEEGLPGEEGQLGEKGLKEDPFFHDHRVLGRATLKDPGTLGQVMQAVYRGIEANQSMVAACFNPRHGIHVRAKGHVVDFVICYECLSMNLYLDGAHHSVLTASAPGAELTRIWQAAGLTIHTGD